MLAGGGINGPAEGEYFTATQAWQSLKRGEKMVVKLFFLGFDGMDYDLLKKYLKQNENASLNKARGSLLLMTPEDELLGTGPCWMTMYTGLSKKNHGIESCWGNPEKFMVFQHPCVWDVLSDFGFTVGLFGLPVTYPPKSIRGFWVSGFPTPPPKTDFNEGGSIIAFPKNIQEKYLGRHVVDIIQAEVGENGELVDWGKPSSNGKIPKAWQTAFHEKMKEDSDYPYKLCKVVSDNQISTIKKMFMDIPVDAVFAQFSFIDHMGHLESAHMMAEERFLKRLYPLADSVMSELLNFFKPENLLITSDHGFKGYNHSKRAIAYFSGSDIME